MINKKYLFFFLVLFTLLTQNLSFEENLIMVNKLIEKNLLSEAIKFLKETLENTQLTKEQKIKAIEKITYLYQKKGQISEAIKFLKEKITETNSLPLNFFLAKLLILNKDYEQANLLLNKIPFYHSLWSDSQYQRSLISLKQNALEEAQKILENILTEANPKVTLKYKIYYKLIKIYLEKSNFLLAESNLEILKLLNDNNDFNEFILELELLLAYYKKDYFLGEKLANKFYKNFPNSPILYDINSIHFNILVSQNRKKKALELINTSKFSSKFSYEKALISYQLKSFQEALYHLNTYIKNNPKKSNSDSILKLRLKLFIALKKNPQIKILLMKHNVNDLSLENQLLFIFAKALIKEKEQENLELIINNYFNFSDKDIFFQSALKLSDIYLKNKDYEKAQNLWNSLSFYYKSYSKIKHADIDLEQKKLFSALKQYKNILSKPLNPINKVYVQNKIVEILSLQKQYLELKDFINQSFEKNNLKEKINFLPTIYNFYEKNNQLKEFSTKIDNILENEQTLPLLQKQQFFFFKAITLHNLKLYKQALFYYNKSFANYKKNIFRLKEQSLLEIAKLFLKYSFFDKAKSVVSIISSNKYLYEKSLVLLNISLKENQLVKTKELLTKLKTLSDKISEELISLEVEYFYLKKEYDAALNLIELSKRSMKNTNLLIRSRLNYYLGSILLDKQQYEGSIKYLMRVFILFPESYYTPFSLFKIIQIYQKTNKFEKAKKLAKELQERFTFFSSKVSVLNYLKKSNLILN